MENTSNALITRTKPQIVIFILGNLQNLTIAPGSPYKGRIKEALMIYCLSKSQMSNAHRYAFITAQSDSLRLVSDIFEVREIVQELRLLEENINLNAKLVQVCQELNIKPDKEYPYVVQVVVVLGENPLEQEINYEALSHKDVYVDIVYVSESEEINDIFFRTLQRNLVLECNNKSYYFKLKRDQVEIYRAMSLLTAHPQQRIPQNEMDKYLTRFAAARPVSQGGNAIH